MKSHHGPGIGKKLLLLFSRLLTLAGLMGFLIVMRQGVFIGESPAGHSPE